MKLEREGTDVNLHLEFDELLSIRNMAKITHHVDLYVLLDQCITNLEELKQTELKVLDIQRKGNVFRFFLGKSDLELWYGDDWDDFPYEYNAGPVYEKFVVKKVDVCFAFDMQTYETYQYNPHLNCSKQELIKKQIPYMYCITDEYAYSFFLGMDWKLCKETISRIEGIYL